MESKNWAELGIVMFPVLIVTYELITGKAHGGGGGKLAFREKNPIRYWSRVGLKIIIALFLIYVIYLKDLF